MEPTTCINASTCAWLQLVCPEASLCLSIVVSFDAPGSLFDEPKEPSSFGLVIDK